MPRCAHADELRIVDPPDPVPGCAECLPVGGTWVHLRMCQECGHVACCDSSPSTHATRHHEETGHPVARSVEPGEDWSWCYVDAVMFRAVGG
ncbi:hypothetical protein GKE82_00135 [Conexibacter sp. W3-3-2]|uniref:UBP-type zinc finger domain-containing protein n=1 Tax=Conexibacter sp. W3-3-2 TaxID=2675227 RepID=UPI0012BA130C|nr:UBP-type zinc finger domain-containing protein [Conexibacter sp. W3-3-2]MTD42751.1 hypothetical protein [Conexibacter sp. W3-3-2]